MPDWKSELRARLAPARLEPAREELIVEELAQHLEQEWERLVARGATEADASRAVLAEIEDSLAARLAAGAARAASAPTLGEAAPGGPFTGLAKDLRYAGRQLRKNPAFTAIAVLSLALGTGANTAIFQLLDAVRLRALPVPHPEEVAVVKLADRKGRVGDFTGKHPDLTNPLWEEIRARQTSFSRMGAWGNEKMDLAKGGESRYVDVLWVSGGFFDALGVPPARGRLIGPADDRPGAAVAIVVSDAFYRVRLGADPDVVGRTLTLNGVPAQVVGVVPARFTGVDVGRGFDVALPIAADPVFHPERPYLRNRQAWWLGVVGRLKPGVTAARASAELGTLSGSIFESTVPPLYEALDAKTYRGFKLAAFPASTGVSDLRERYQEPLFFLMGISGFVLLVACANLASLMLSRASARQREIAVRLALGASRARLVRQLLAESLLLASAGAVLGAALAQGISRLLVSYLSTQHQPILLDLEPDARLFLFTAALAGVTCLLFGLAPALQASRTAPGEALKASARGVAGGRFGLRRALVVAQVAVSLALLVGALLFVRTFRNLQTLDPGFSKDQILLSVVDLSQMKLPPERRIAARTALTDRIRALPGVVAAADVAIVPLSGSGWNERIRVDGASVEREFANFNRVGPGFFKAMGTALLSGRDFDAHDTRTSTPVAVVTEAFAKRFLSGKSPLGARIRVTQQGGKPDDVYEIVGLVRDVKYRTLREDFNPLVFLAQAQDPEPDDWVAVLVRASAPLDLVPAVTRAALESSPAARLNFQPFAAIVREALVKERLMATLSGILGALAAVLAMAGLYGVVSYMVARRRSEIGVRIALGADRADILRLVMGESGRLLGIGVALGTGLALLAAAPARALLYGLSPTDPLTLAAAALALSAIAAAASLFPASRAASLDPVRTLREE